MQLLQEITFTYAKVQLFDTQIIRIEITGNNIIDLHKAREINNAIGVLSKGKQSLIVLLAEELADINKEAMEFSASEEGLRYTIADAMVVRSVGQRLKANFYLKFNKPLKPSKIFNSEKEAIKWLQAIKNNLIPA